MAYTAEQQSIIDQATALNPSNPRLALWQWSQANGYAPEFVDQFMGWEPGSTLGWAVQNGQAPAPQGDSSTQLVQAPVQAPVQEVQAPVQQPVAAATPAAPVAAPVQTPAVQTPAVSSATVEALRTPAAPAPTPTPTAAPAPAPTPAAPTPAPAPAPGPKYTAQQQYIIDQATSINPENPRLALWNWAQANNVAPEQIDQYMGWTPGASLEWAVQNGQSPAPQGNFNTRIPSMVDAKSPLTGGGSQASPGMGWNPAVVGQPGGQQAGPDNRSYQSNLIKSLRDTSPQGGPAGGVTNFSPVSSSPPKAPSYSSEQQAIIDEATRRAKANNTTPQLEAWNYAMGQNNNDPKKSSSMLDNYFGWSPGSSMQWAVSNGQYNYPKVETVSPVIDALRTPAATSNTTPAISIPSSDVYTGVYDSGNGGGNGYAKGGKVTGDKLAGPDPEGPDDGYAALDKGEYVIKKAAVQKYGKKMLDQINALRK